MVAKHPWWNPETSWVGVACMVAGVLVAYLYTSTHFQLSEIQAWAAGAICGLVVGLIYNVVAHLRGTKKIHWIDFFFFDILPW